jgi:hypothetical protein
MTAEITIPPAALEAAARAVYDRAQEDDLMPWSSLPEPFKAGWLTEAGVTIRAALAAWPFRKDEWRDNITFDGKLVRYSVITLPLPQEGE